MTRTQVFSWFFFGIFLLIIHLFYEIRKPFIFSLLWAGILALVLYPLHECLTRVLKYTGGNLFYYFDNIYRICCYALIKYSCYYTRSRDA
jgi:predicted PurR-regulated permease PerM